MKYMNVLNRYYDPLRFDAPGPVHTTETAGSGNNLTPENNKVFYDRNLVKLVGPMLIHDQFAKKVDVPQNRGKNMEFRGFEPLEKALTPLTEGVTPSGAKLDMFTVTASLKQYGDYVALSDMLQMTAIDPMVLEAQDSLGDQAGRTLDTVTREVINAGTNVIYGDGSVTARNAVTSAMTLTVKTVKKAVRALKVQNAPKINGKYMAIIHPDAAYDLSEDPEYKELFKYTDHSSFTNGFLWGIAGVEFYESTEAKKWAKAGASGVDIYSTIITGKDAYATTTLNDRGLETIVKPLGAGDDPLNQRSTVGWKSEKAVAILVQQYMVRLENASAFNDGTAN